MIICIWEEYCLLYNSEKKDSYEATTENMKM